jgi:hypothetical protein
MKPSAISLIAAELFLGADVVIYAVQGYPWMAAGWGVAMFVAWRFYKWSCQ